MNLQVALAERSNGACELCGSDEGLSVYTVPPKSGVNLDEVIHVCGTCSSQLNDSDRVNANHWRCLNDSMWSEVDAVKVVAYRMLHSLRAEGWPADLLEMMYMEDSAMTWAKEGISDSEDAVVHRDSNGVVLEAGDSVVVIKDLNVKGSSIVAKRGTAVRNIRLVHDNPEHIEGKVDGQNIVILTKYVKK
ncbi:MAG: alkylphosphonate utilization protein [Crocinitomicaceae bacterium]